MGRISMLLAAGSLLVLGNQAGAQEIRQVAPGITMSPGLTKPSKPKVEEKAASKIETSKSQATTYGAPVSPVLSADNKIETPQPSKPAVTVKSAEKPAVVPGQSETSRPVAASSLAVTQPNTSGQSEQKAVTAPREQVRNVSANAAGTKRELKVGDRIPDDVQLYDSPRRAGSTTPVRVGDRVPDNVQLYDLPRSALR